MVKTSRLPKLFQMKTWQRTAGVTSLALLAISTTAVPAVVAATSSESKQRQAKIGNQITDLSDQADELSEQEIELLTRMREIQARKADLDGQVSSINAQMDDARRQIAAAQKVVDDQRKREAEAKARLAEAEAKLEESAVKMRQQAVNAYVGGQTGSELASFVLSSDDMREASAASEYINQVVEVRRHIVEENRELRGQADDAAKQVEGARKQAEAALAVVAQREADLNVQKIQLDAVSAQVAQEASAQAALVAEVDSKRDEINARIASLQAESDRIGALLRQSDTPGVPAPPARPGALTNPVPGARMTSPFGMRVNPVTGVYRLHAGQDFGISVGTPLHAAESGKVVQAGWVSGYGNYTCISHGGGLATCYAHQSQIMVGVGSNVSRGQVIGLGGNTGNSTGPHLHFEVRVNGNPVNPVGYL